MGKGSVTYLFSQQRGCCAGQEGIPCAASWVPGELLVFPPGGPSRVGGNEGSLTVLPCLSFGVLLLLPGRPQQLLRLFCSNNLEQVVPAHSRDQCGWVGRVGQECPRPPELSLGSLRWPHAAFA